jgi:hypothetical protein
MFSYNIMRYSARRVVAEHGYRSVISSFKRQGSRYARVLRRHGIHLRDPRARPASPSVHAYRSPLARSLAASLDRLGSRLKRG